MEENILIGTRILIRIGTLSGYCSNPGSDYWYPLPPGTDNLNPPPPDITTNPNPLPPDTVPLPPGFDSDDLCYVFNDLLPTGQDPVYPVTLDPGALYPPYVTITPLLLRLKTQIKITDYNYSLNIEPGYANLIIKVKVFPALGFRINPQASSYSSAGGVAIFDVVSSSIYNFNIVQWNGDGAEERVISPLGLSPGLVWYRTRTQFDSIDTSFKFFAPAFVSNDQLTYYAAKFTTGQASSVAPYLSFGTNQFTLRQSSNSITSGNKPPGSVVINGQTYTGTRDYIAYCWAGNTTVTISNTGTVASVVNTNQSLGYSTFSYTGTGIDDTTFGHGLGSTPEIFFLFTSNQAYVGGSIIGNNSYLQLSSGPVQSSSFYLKTVDTQNITIGPISIINAANTRYLGIAFTSIPGFCTINKYIANGAASRFIPTDFPPKLVLVKVLNYPGSSTTIERHWVLADNVRSANFRVRTSDDPEFTPAKVTIQSNGFTVTSTLNSNYVDVYGQTVSLEYLYIAIGEVSYTYEIVLANGIYSSIGGEALLSRTGAVNAEPGIVTLQGQDVIIKKIYNPFNASDTTYNYYGYDASFVIGKQLLCDGQIYTSAGENSTLTKASKTIADNATYYLNGKDALLKKSYFPLIADSTNYTSSGQSVTLTGQLNIIASAGSYGSQGNTILMSKATIFMADFYAYNASGQDVILSLEQYPYYSNWSEQNYGWDEQWKEITWGS